MRRERRLKPWHYLLTAAGLLVALWGLLPHGTDLARIESLSGEHDEAIALFERELKLSPRDKAVQRRLLEAYERAGAQERALAFLEHQAARRPLEKNEREAGQRLALGIGSPARALALLEKDATDAELPDLVKLALQADDLAAARRLQARLLAAKPADESVLLKARDLALAASDRANALAYQRRLYALTKTPGQAQKLVELAVAAGDAPTAIAAQRDLMKLEPGEAARRRLVELYLQLNDPAGALDAYEAARPARPDEAWLLRAAQLAEWAGQPQRALPHLAALYAARQDAASGKRYFGALVAAKDPRVPALALELARRFPQDETLAAQARAILVASGRVDEALALLARDVSRRPGARTAHKALVELALGQGRRGVAIAELRRWVRRAPADVEALHQLAVALVWDRQPDVGWGVYARLLDGQDGQRPVASQPPLAWREQWLAISTQLHDFTLAGQTNLRVLVAREPGRIDWRRRLAHSLMETGHVNEALAQQRELLKLAGARRNDEDQLVTWLLWYGRLDEVVARLRAMDARHVAPLPLLREAANQAAAARRWNDASDLLARVAAARPRERQVVEALARARIEQGDTAGAAAAWRQRLRLPQVTPAMRLETVALLRRLDRRAEALALLEEGPAVTPLELRERVSLAYELQRPRAEEDALRQLLARVPGDSQALAALGELLDARGARAEADRLFDQALAARPDDGELLARLAARKLYGPDPASAGPLVERLAREDSPSDTTLRVLADYYTGRDDGRAAAALDRLHARGGGDAETWLRRGELAEGQGDHGRAREFWARALALAGDVKTAHEPQLQELRASVLERLGRDAEAREAWEALLTAQPRRVSPLLALARLRLAARNFAEARVYLDRALALEPRNWDARVLAGELALETRQGEAALALVRSLRAERPALPYLVGLEARARALLGQRRAARNLARGVADAQPDLRELYRGLRDDGSHGVTGIGEYEDAPPLLTRRVLGARARWHAHDRVQLEAEARQLEWGSYAAPAEEVALAAEGRLGAASASGRVAIARQGGQVQAPLGQASLSYELASVTGRVGVAEARWEDAGAAVARTGRERRAEAELAWRPDPRFTARAQGMVGQLHLDGARAGDLTDGLGELLLRPDAASPWSLSYQFRHRIWGLAGPLVGLPEGVDFHTFMLGYARRWGPLRFELQPGYALDGRLWIGAPTVATLLAWEPAADVELLLDMTWSGRGFLMGTDGNYQRWALGGRWWF